MGYEIDFIPTKEFIEEKIKPLMAYKLKPTEIPITETEILVYVMKNGEETRSVMNHLYFQLKYLRESVRMATIQDAIKQFESEGRIWYCGWEYAKDSYSQDIDDVTNNVIRTFTLLKQTVPTADYFKDGDHYYEKVNEIEEQLEYFTDTCRDATIYEIMDLLRPFVEKDDDEDDEKDDEKDETFGGCFGKTDDGGIGGCFGVIDNEDQFRPLPGDEVILGSDGDLPKTKADNI